MLRVLLVDDNEDLLEVLTVLLSLEAKFDIVAASSLAEAVDHLKSRDDIDAIISDYQLQDGNGSELYAYNKTRHQLPFALFSAFFPEDCDGLDALVTDNPLNRFIRKSVEEKKLFDFILDVERSKLSETQKRESPDFLFHRLPLSFLRKFEFKNIDYFVKLKEDHFVKISNAGEGISSQLETYEQKNVHFLFVKIEDLGVLFSEIGKLIHDSKEGSGTIEDEVVSIANIHFEISLVALKHLGLRREHIEYINKSLTTSIEKLNKNGEFKGFLEKLNQNESLFKNHSLLTLYLATPMIYTLGWNSPSTIERIVHAALFHDMGLMHPHLCDFENQETNKGLLNSAEEKELRSHPSVAAELLKKHDFIHLETIKIIQEHHERPDGRGYPAGLSAQHVSALGAAFIIAHDFAHSLLKSKYDLNAFKFYLAEKKGFYQIGQYKRCIEAFNQIANQIK